MWRNSDAHTVNRPPASPDDPVSESSKTRLRLPRIRSKDFQVGSPGSLRLSEHLDHGIGITSVGYCGHPRSVTQLQAAASCLEKFTGCAGGLQLAQPPDPGRKLALMYLFREAGEFQMGMCVDQPRDNDRWAKLLHRGIWRPRYYRISSYLGDAPLGVDQERAVLDWCSLGGNQPVGGQPARPHLSVESWARGPCLP
jgi:hypothetical protein